MAGREIAKGFASSPTEASGERARCATMARRVGSASAPNVASRAAELLTIWLTISREPAGPLSSGPGYWSAKVFVRNTAICPRGLVGRTGAVERRRGLVQEAPFLRRPRPAQGQVVKALVS